MALLPRFTSHNSAKAASLTHLTLRLIAGFVLAILVESANAQITVSSLSQERELAKKAGWVLSTESLSEPMPLAIENAAPLYIRFADTDNARARAEGAPYGDDTKPDPSQRDAQLVREASWHPILLTETEWLRVQKVMAIRAKLITIVREASGRPKCVFCKNEYVSKSDGDAINDIYNPSNMLNPAELLTCESMVEAHDHKLDLAIRDLNLSFNIAHHTSEHNTIPGFITASTVEAMTINGLKNILRMYPNNTIAFQFVLTSISSHLHRAKLSETLKIEAAIGQSTIDEIKRVGPGAVGRKSESPIEYSRWIDDYGAFELNAIRRSAELVDLPYAQSAVALQAILADAEAKYPEHGNLPNPITNYTDLQFHRDTVTNSRNVTVASVAVLAYHVKHGKYPITLATAMPDPPTDAFDGKALHYEVTAKGFIVSASHQRARHKPEVASFTYPK